jgi:hypothetical protein
MASFFFEQSDINSIIKEYLNSEIGKKYQEFDCKTVTRAFVKWAKEKGIHANVVLLAAPSIELVRENPKKYGGSSGEGDQHIMPVVNNHAIDFTIRQFGLPNTYFQPVITPINNLESVYGKFGYFTNTFHEGGESSYRTTRRRKLRKLPR